MRKINFGVLCPIQGRYYSALWHTRNEGQHLVLAKSLNGLKYTFHALFKKYIRSDRVDNPDYDFKLSSKDAELIEIVMPPQSYCARVEALLYEQAVDTFERRIHELTNKFQESELPPQLVFCRACISQKFRGCEKCDWRAVQPQNTTWEELFDKFGEDLEALDKFSSESALKFSMAPAADESELHLVYGVYPDFGRGVSVRCLLEHQGLETMFFFKKLGPIDITSSIDELKEAQEKNREDAKKARADFHKSMEARDLEKKKKYMLFFEKMRQAARG